MRLSKRVLCVLMAVLLIAGFAPDAYCAVDTVSGPAMAQVHFGSNVFAAPGGGLRMAANPGEYPNNPPESVDTVEEKVDWIAEQCRLAGVTDPWEIALWLHNWLIYNANYDYTFTNYDADGVLLKGTGVCNSYMLAYGLLLDEFGIEHMNLVSMEMNHGWNLVKLDGRWCHVDCTWDDPGEGGGYENHSYFGMDDELMSRDHVWDRAAYPACTGKENYYLIRTGGNVFSSPEEMMLVLSELAAARTETLKCCYIGTDPNFQIYETFREWYKTYNWKFGTLGYRASYTYSMLTVEMAYGEPWQKPEDFDANHAHRYVQKVTPATCTQKGETVYACSCGDRFVTEQEALGHSETVLEPSGPTCTDPGWTQGLYCITCGEILIPQEEIPANGHNWSGGSCTEPRTCTVCGETDGDAEGHRWSGGSCTTVPVCTVCGESADRPVGHRWSQATCTTAPTCAVCGEINGRPAGHRWSDATCTAPKTCSICGETTGSKQAHTYDSGVDGTCNVCGIHREDTENRTVMHMFRMYDPNSGEHFYTGSVEERENLIAAGWNYEGVGFTFSRTTGLPVYRLYDPVTGEHLYTMDEEEKELLEARGWNFEGIAFNSAYDTEVPQFRLHNPNETRGAYHFTSSTEERDYLISLGWEYQGIGFYSSWK